MIKQKCETLMDLVNYDASEILDPVKKKERLVFANLVLSDYFKRLAYFYDCKAQSIAQQLTNEPRKCAVCKKEKEITEFIYQHHIGDGPHRVCKDCNDIYHSNFEPKSRKSYKKTLKRSCKEGKND